MEGSTFSLNDVLGWKDDNPLTSPLVVVNDNLVGNSDAITSTFISHCIKTGGSVCVIGAARPASHYANICKKQGVALDRARRGGLYYHIDCLLSTVAPTSGPETSRKDMNALPGFTMTTLADRIARAFAHWQSLQVTSLLSTVPTCITKQTSFSLNDKPNSEAPLLPRFNVIIDDIEAIADVYANGSTSVVLDLINFLVHMVTTPKRDISSILVRLQKHQIEFPTHILILTFLHFNPIFLPLIMIFFSTDCC